MEEVFKCSTNVYAMPVYAVESGCLGGFVEAYDKGLVGHGLVTFGSLVCEEWATGRWVIDFDMSIEGL